MHFHEIALAMTANGFTDAAELVNAMLESLRPLQLVSPPFEDSLDGLTKRCAKTLPESLCNWVLHTAQANEIAADFYTKDGQAEKAKEYRKMAKRQMACFEILSQCIAIWNTDRVLQTDITAPSPPSFLRSRFDGGNMSNMN